jgi:signal transduction histidine kinase
MSGRGAGHDDRGVSVVIDRLEPRAARRTGRTARSIAPGRRPAPNRWLTLFVVTRAAGAGVALLLLAAHPITPYDTALGVLVLVYGVGSIVAAARVPSLQRSTPAAAVDCAVALGFVLAGGDWRSAFYLLALSALVLPATTLSFRRALWFGALFDVAYLAVAVRLGVGWSTVDTTARVETFATHLIVPLLVVLSLAYAADLLRRLRGERRRAERALLEAERQRMAWELHDSVKQRMHAAHLLVSAAPDAGPAIAQARTELEAAVAEMDRCVQALRDPVPRDSGLVHALRARAAALAHAGTATIGVEGDEPRLPPAVAEHAYRIAAEAITNAVRHADAMHVAVELRTTDGRVLIGVRDDGRGLDTTNREGAGLASMRARAAAVGADLEIAGGPDGHGTEVRLSIPLTDLDAEELQ